MYKCISLFETSVDFLPGAEPTVYLLDDEIDYAEFQSLTAEEQKNFEKIYEND